MILTNHQHRSSTSAYIQRRQTTVVQCIEQRFAQFQGDIDPLRIEPLQVVKYESHQQVCNVSLRSFSNLFFLLVQTAC